MKQMKELKSLVQQTKHGLSSYYLTPTGIEVRLINIRDIANGTILSEEVETARVKQTAALEKSRIVPGDIIIAAKGSAFKAAIAPNAAKGFVFSGNLIAFTLGDEIRPQLVAAYLNSSKGQAELQSRAIGVAQKSLTVKALMEIKIPVPSLGKQKALAEYISLSSEYDLIVRREQELRKRVTDKIISNYMQG